MIMNSVNGPAVSRIRFQSAQPAPAKQPDTAGQTPQPAPAEPKPTSNNEIIDQLTTMGYQLFDVPPAQEKAFQAALIGTTQKAHLSMLSLVKNTQDPAKIDTGIRVVIKNGFDELQQAGFKPSANPDLQTFLTKLLPTVEPKLADFFQSYLVSTPGDSYGAGLKKRSAKSIAEKTWAAVSPDDKNQLKAQLKAMMAKLFTPVAFQQAGQAPANFDTAFEKATAKWQTALQSLINNPSQRAEIPAKTQDLAKGFIDSMAEGGFAPTRNLDVKEFVADLASAQLFILPKLYKALTQDAKFSLTEKPIRYFAVGELDKRISFITDVDPATLPEPPIKLTEEPTVKPHPVLVPNPPKTMEPPAKILGLPRRWAIEAGRFVATVAASVGITLGIVGTRAPQPAPQPPAPIQQREVAPNLQKQITPAPNQGGQKKDAPFQAPSLRP